MFIHAVVMPYDRKQLRFLIFDIVLVILLHHLQCFLVTEDDLVVVVWCICLNY